MGAKKLNNSGEMDTVQAAEYCLMKPKTLRNYLAMGQGPRCIKRFGRLIFLAADLDAWVKHNTVTRKAMGR